MVEVSELWQTAAMHPPKILKFKLNKEKHYSRQIYLQAFWGEGWIATLDKYLMLPRYLQLNLASYLLTLEEGTFFIWKRKPILSFYNFSKI